MLTNLENDSCKNHFIQNYVLWANIHKILFSQLSHSLISSLACNIVQSSKLNWKSRWNYWLRKKFFKRYRVNLDKNEINCGHQASHLKKTKNNLPIDLFINSYMLRKLTRKINLIKKDCIKIFKMTRLNKTVCEIFLCNEELETILSVSLIIDWKLNNFITVFYKIN